jgi:hypothetical protein
VDSYRRLEVILVEELESHEVEIGFEWELVLFLPEATLNVQIDDLLDFGAALLYSVDAVEDNANTSILSGFFRVLCKAEEFIDDLLADELIVSRVTSISWRMI